MLVMDTKSLTERDVLQIDLESGIRSVINGEEASRDGGSSVRKAKKMPNRERNGYVGIDGSIRGEEFVHSGSSTVEGSLERFGGEEKVSLLESKTGAEKPKKQSCKKPPKLPRPPKSPSLDATDRKLIREISELAMLKKARIERMKALKKMKNAKSKSSSSNLGALIITALFCLVIIWQGFFSRGSSSLSFQGSPGSSVATRTGLISVQFYNNGSADGLHGSSSAFPNNAGALTGLDDHGKTSRGAG
ncbi:uncharacterized protein [Elaeis guineensis]|uniref:Uncharacterized protein LOC105057323 n=1 Tax=Elaeis guineensis var. tenera TaxID=51953 RepID=A0A6I9S609_ELAGV|nr:uncharacterized protein LOC105057323 [Elaeis guineensis]